MKKESTKMINAIVEKEYNRVCEDMKNGVQFINRLRSCNAEILASDKYYLLRSYNTIVAAIDADGYCYDFLRLVYGYTATSAQHISKFYHDLGGVEMYRYYPL